LTLILAQKFSKEGDGALVAGFSEHLNREFTHLFLNLDVAVIVYTAGERA
jgi:hypothetical protein